MGNGKDWADGRLTVSQAIDYCKARGVSVSRPTMGDWVNKFNLGIQLGKPKGRYVIDKRRLSLFINAGEVFSQPLKEDFDERADEISPTP